MRTHTQTHTVPGGKETEEQARASRSLAIDKFPRGERGVTRNNPGSAGSERERGTDPPGTAWMSKGCCQSGSSGENPKCEERKLR